MASKKFTHFQTRTVTEVVTKSTKKNMVLYVPYMGSTTAIRYNRPSKTFEITADIDRDTPYWEKLNWNVCLDWEDAAYQTKFLQHMVRLIKETK